VVLGSKDDTYGNQFLTVIQQYCTEHGLSSRITEKSPKRERKESKLSKTKIDTKAETYKLYKEGIAIGDIAKQRSLTIQTIEVILLIMYKSGYRYQ